MAGTRGAGRIAREAIEKALELEVMLKVCPLGTLERNLCF